MRRFNPRLALAVTVVSVSGALAQPQAKDDARLKLLEQQLRDVQAQLAEIKTRDHVADDAAAIADLKRSTSAQYADISKRMGETATTLDNGRLSIVSANGNFSLAVRSLVQFDYGYFSQGKNPAGVDLNSGSNFRRAQFGLVGTLWKDWTYNFTYDFGGQGVEKNGYIYYAYLQYDGLAPFHIRGGAIAPFAGIEDATGSGDLLFLERPASADIARSIAGSNSREGIDLFVQGDNYLLSVAYTGKKTADAATFDEQQAVVGRASWLAVNGKVKWLLDADVTHVFKLADAAPNTDTSNFYAFSTGPELTVDSTKTVNTGNLDAKAITEIGLETAAEYAGLYAQGGWFRYDIVRRTALVDPDFSGWYALLTYSLTGEEHAYDATTASFRGLRPLHPLGTPGGWGALEVKARYSNIDLDYQPLVAAASGGVTGGVQNVRTVGLNWYPTNGIKFELDYDNLQVSHVNAPTSAVSANAIAVRGQISL